MTLELCVAYLQQPDEIVAAGLVDETCVLARACHSLNIGQVVPARGMEMVRIAKSMGVTVAAAAVIAMSHAGHAADLRTPVYKAPPPPVMALYNWSGCYIGGNVGGKWARTSGSVDLPAATGAGGASVASSFPLERETDSTLIGGGQIGCNWQSGNWVFGIEGDADAQDWHATRVVGLAPPTLFVTGDTFDVRSRWQASARARLGYAWDRTLLYVTGGAAWTDVRVGSNFIAFGLFPATVATDRATILGGTFGGGLEYAFGNNWSLGIEGRYTWYGNHTYGSGLVATSGGPPFTFAPATTTLKVSTAEVIGKLNYRFTGY
jgi:outer membrane immunogenic protein